MASSLNREEILAHIAEQAFSLTIRDREKGFTSIWLFGDAAAESAPVLDPRKLVTTFPLEKRDEAVSQVKNLEEFEKQRTGIIGLALQFGQSQLVEDVKKVPQYYVKSDPKTRSELAVPIKIDETVVGVINIEAYELAAFNEKTKYEIESLAAKAAVALRAAREHDYLKLVIGNIKNKVTDLLRKLDSGLDNDSLKQRLRSIEEISERIRDSRLW